MTAHYAFMALDITVNVAIFAALLVGIVKEYVPQRWRLTVGMLATVALLNLVQSLLALRQPPGPILSVDRLFHAAEISALIVTILVLRNEVLRPVRLLDRSESHSRVGFTGLDAIPALVITSTHDGVVRKINHYGLELLGSRARAVVGREIFRLAPKGDLRKRVKHDFLQFVGSSGTVGVESEYPIETVHGTRLMRWRRTAQIDGRGMVIGVVSHGEDITERRETEERLTAESHLLDSVHDAVIVTSPEGRRLYFNRAAHDMLGLAEEEFSNVEPFAWIDASSRRLAQLHLAEARRLGDHMTELVGVREDGTELPLELRSQKIRFEHQDCVMTVFRDISSRRQAQDLIERMAYTDPLTGLANRRLALDRLALEVSDYVEGTSSLAVLYLDVDNLKHVNDTLGHEGGDQLVRIVGERLLEVVRGRDLVSRVGGDEFVIVAAEAGAATEVTEIAARILARLSEPVCVRGHEMSVAASVGIASATGVETPEQLITMADRAMYFAKRSGGGKYLVHTPSMDDEFLDEFVLQNDLTHALERNELVVEYQPIVDASTGRVVAAEALLRWRHPERGMLQPSQFIGLAEQSGAIRPIGHWVLRHACATLKTWRAAGLDIERVAVNVSPLQLCEPSFVRDVFKAAETVGLPTSCIELEITETQAMDHSEEVEGVFRRLGEGGVRIALDDFGVGHSSLERLRRWPISTLKLDRTFVADLCTSSSAHPIVETVLVLAANLGLVVVAEGVETACQAEYLRDAGCDYLQGFAFARPGSASWFAEFAGPVISPTECPDPCGKSKLRRKPGRRRFAKI
ncbi:MAG TPA: EAL domain-containing protein [Coriobacteriia bacterium]|nr:EAL domain-containing protein [Coriobacteriia bacterium]